MGQCLSISLPCSPLFHYSITPCEWPPLLWQISLIDNGVLDKIEETPVLKGFDITRYNLANEPDQFADTAQVNKVLHEQGPDALPVVLKDGEVVKVGTYPTNEELATWFGVSVEELKAEKPRVRLKLNINNLK